MARCQRLRGNVHSKLIMGEICVSVPFAHKEMLKPSHKLTFLSQCFESCFFVVVLGDLYCNNT